MVNVRELEEQLARIKIDKQGFKKEIKRQRKANNRLARELGYPRGIKQMKMEGAL